MASRNSNEAYDFALFEPKRQQQESQPQKKSNIIALPQEKLEQNRKAKVRPIKAVSTFLVLAVMLGIVSTMVYGQVQLTELTEKLNSATKTYNEGTSLYTQLQMKSDSKLSLETVESYATDKLGLKKVDQNQVVPISLSKGDKTQVLQNDSDVSWPTALWNSIMQLLS